MMPFSLCSSSKMHFVIHVSFSLGSLCLLIFSYGFVVSLYLILACITLWLIYISFLVVVDSLIP